MLSLSQIIRKKPDICVLLGSFCLVSCKHRQFRSVIKNTMCYSLKTDVHYYSSMGNHFIYLSIISFMYYLVFRDEFLCVVLAVLKFLLETRLALNSEICLCVSAASLLPLHSRHAPVCPTTFSFLVKRKVYFTFTKSQETSMVTYAYYPNTWKAGVRRPLSV